MSPTFKVVDIETECLPEVEVMPFMPEFAAPVNFKNPELILANLQQQRERWLADGALSALTGQILVIGTKTGQTIHTYEGGEAQMLFDFWEDCRTWLAGGGMFVGHACRRFDFPFMVRRSWKYGIRPPEAIWYNGHLSHTVLDTCERWGCGSHEARDRISLAHLATFLGVGAKNGSGADFGRLWHTDKVAAITYLHTDLDLTGRVAERLFGLNP